MKEVPDSAVGCPSIEGACMSTNWGKIVVDVRTMLAKNGLELRKVRNTRSNVGKHAEWVLIEQLNLLAPSAQAVELTAACLQLGPWMSAGIDDETACAEFRDAALRFINAIDHLYAGEEK